MEVSGMDRNRTYFSQEITTDVIDGAGMAEVHLIGQLPQDDMTKFSMAQIAREGPTPLLSDRAIRDRILAIQDADQMDDAIKEQIAEKMLPEATLWSMMQAAERQGRQDLVDFYLGELLAILFDKRQMLQQKMAAAMSPPMPPSPDMGMGMPPPPGGPPMGGPPTGGPPGLPPEVMPNAMMGVPPPMPTPPPGPMVPPGTPRPGAQGGP